VDYLHFSAGPFFDAENYEVGKTQDELHTFWLSHRVAILSRFSEENRAKGPGWAGIRPWPFYELEDRAPRLKTAPKEFDSQKVWDPQRHVHDWVESDIEYLGRLGLLQEWELAPTMPPPPTQAGEVTEGGNH
jgi:hypothetical protein